LNKWVGNKKPLHTEGVLSFSSVEVAGFEPATPCSQSRRNYFLLKRYKTGSIVPIITAGKIEYSPPNILDITVIRIAVTDIIMITGKYFFICFISILNDLF
jgi:hypothetical protein